MREKWFKIILCVFVQKKRILIEKVLPGAAKQFSDKKYFWTNKLFSFRLIKFNFIYSIWKKNRRYYFKIGLSSVYESNWLQKCGSQEASSVKKSKKEKINPSVVVCSDEFLLFDFVEQFIVVCCCSMLTFVYEDVITAGAKIRRLKDDANYQKKTLWLMAMDKMRERDSTHLTLSSKYAKTAQIRIWFELQ